MAEKTRRRRRLLLLAVLVGVAGYFYTRLRVPADSLGESWPVPHPDRPAEAVPPAVPPAVVRPSPVPRPAPHPEVAPEALLDPDPPGKQQRLAARAPESESLFTPTTAASSGAGPRSDGSAPGPEFTIKGNADSMLFHPPHSPYYKRTNADVWFRSADEARTAGFTEWTPKKRAAG